MLLCHYLPYLFKSALVKRRKKKNSILRFFTTKKKETKDFPCYFSVIRLFLPRVLIPLILPECYDRFGKKLRDGLRISEIAGKKSTRDACILMYRNSGLDIYPDWSNPDSKK